MSAPKSSLGTSEEFDDRQRELAGEEGAANQRSVRHMIEEVAQTGDQREVGDYVVAIAIEEAEGLYELAGEGEFEWHEPEAENCHLEVSVSDAADGRFVPELSIEVTLDPDEGDAVGPVDVPFVWHPGLYHYGANLTVPGDGTYDVHVRIEPPEFRRHDRENGRRFAETVETTFTDVPIETGQS